MKISDGTQVFSFSFKKVWKMVFENVWKPGSKSATLHSWDRPISKEWISKRLIGNRFHVKLRTLSPLIKFCWSIPYLPPLWGVLPYKC